MRKNIRCYTLTEILVAVAVLMLMMTFLLQFVIGSQRIWYASSRTSSLFEKAQIVFDVMERDIKQSLFSNEKGESIPMFLKNSQDASSTVGSHNTLVKFGLVTQMTSKDIDYDFLGGALFNIYDTQNFEKEQAEREEKRARERFNELIKGCEKSKESIYYKITEKGTGDKVGKGKNVTVGYCGYLVDGTLFDASKEFHPQGHDPLDFVTGAGKMIPGFDMMVQDMKLNEKRTVLLPPDLAYGERGAGRVIPPNTPIMFDIEVIEVTD